VRRGQTLVILGQKFAQKGQRIFGCWHRVLARIIMIFGEQRWDTVRGEPVPSPRKSQTTATISAPAKSRLCLTRGNKHDAATLSTVKTSDGEDTFMNKLVLSAVAVLALLSIVSCAQYYGKGKAPPPVVTKG
jgi:hypothetical protein